MLFGIPGEITNITRILEMIKRERFIYRAIVFGHWKCLGVPGTYRVTGRGSGHPPGNYMGLMGQELDRPAPKGLVRPM